MDFLYFIINQGLGFWASIIFIFLVVAAIIVFVLIVQFSFDLRSTYKPAIIVGCLVSVILIALSCRCVNDYKYQLQKQKNEDLLTSFLDVNFAESFDKFIIDKLHVNKSYNNPEDGQSTN